MRRGMPAGTATTAMTMATMAMRKKGTVHTLGTHTITPMTMTMTMTMATATATATVMPTERPAARHRQQRGSPP